jgi:hypothetical protein
MMGEAKAHYDGIVAFSQTDFTEDLKRITVPVLVMHGDDDQIVPNAHSGNVQGLSARHAHDRGRDLQRRPAGLPERVRPRTPAEVGGRGEYKKLSQALAGLVESAGGVPMPQAIDRKEVQRLMREGVPVVEVLPREEFEDDHLPGAISLPLRSLEAEARDRLDPAKPVIVYCWDAA